MSSEESEQSWYLAQLKPNGMRLALRNLERQGFRSFVPQEQASRRRRGRISTEWCPLFPGYVFVSFDPSEGHWRAINSTQGVARLVAFGSAPARVPPGLMSELMARCDGAGRLRPPPLPEPGDAVRLVSVSGFCWRFWAARPGSRFRRTRCAGSDHGGLSGVSARDRAAGQMAHGAWSCRARSLHSDQMSTVMSSKRKYSTEISSSVKPPPVIVTSVPEVRVIV